MKSFLAISALAVVAIGCGPTGTPTATSTNESTRIDGQKPVNADHAHTEKCEWCQGDFAKSEVVTKGGKVTCKACAEFH